MATPLTSPASSSLSVALPDEQATRRLAIDIANTLQAGDFITFSGDLGAGKTTFARALIRYLAGDPEIEVPSPTFTLMQTYDLPQFTLVHVDLFRLSGPADLAELGLDDLTVGTVVLLEWPERAGNLLPPDRLDIELSLAPKLKLEFRHARVTGYGSFRPRVDRLAATRQFMVQSGYSEAARVRLQGDASTRIYERLTLGDQHVILMNAPRRPDGPPVRDGKPYSDIAHLADNVAPFVAIADGLRRFGFSTPTVHHADLTQGLLILEDLGNETVVEDDPPAPIMARYETAVDMLLALHGKALPEELPVASNAPNIDYRIPRYDIDAFLIEAELLLDWYLPRLAAPVPDSERASFRALWRDLLQRATDGPSTWVLRDFHSPNLLWLPQREGIARLGILDFQDAVIGPPAYDLASLLQDARIDVPEQDELALLGRYVRGRRERAPDFDATGFIKIYVTLAAQRASKILGIFARLDMRDGKPQYLRHMPRVWNYLQRSLGHPTLESLAAWYLAHVPALNSI
jgi:N-acetylmuramate 1-kinase